MSNQYTFVAYEIQRSCPECAHKIIKQQLNDRQWKLAISTIDIQIKKMERDISNLRNYQQFLKNLKP